MTKENGYGQLFDKDKIVRTCLRMGANSHIAFEVAEKVEERLYDGLLPR